MGVYTYVLFGKRIDNDAPDLQPIVKKRYEQLLLAIAASSERLTSFEASERWHDRRAANLFCIPWRSSGTLPKSPSVDDYNSALADDYLGFAKRAFVGRREIIDQLRVNPGPFLISSTVRLTESVVPLPLLFADLSGTNPGAMNEVVAAYKRELGGDFAGVQQFSSVRLALLNVVLDYSSYVEVIAPAVAETIKKAKGKSE